MAALHALISGLPVKTHFFVYSRRATHDPHHTWHGDRGSPPFLHPPTFSDPISCFTARGVEICGKISPPWENAYNLVVCPPKVIKLT